MKLIRVNWSKLTLAQSILLSVGVLALGAVLLFGKRLGLDGDYIKMIVGAGIPLLTALGFFANQKDES